MDALAPRVRELVALRVGATRDSAYVWSGHAPIARDSGLTSEEIAGVAVGPTAFEGRDALVLSAVDALLTDGSIDAATRHALGERDALSVLIATQFYETLASIMQDAAPEPDTLPIPGLETPSRAKRTAAETMSAGVSPLTGRALPPRAEVQAARERNLQRGFEERKRLLADAIGVREVAALLDVGRQTPHDRRIAGTLLGVKDRGQWRFPTWQFDADGPDGVVRGLPDALQALRGPISDLGRVRWFVTPKGDLEDRAPIDALRSGDVEDVIALAGTLGAS